MRTFIKNLLLKTRLDPMLLCLRAKGIVKYNKYTKTYVRDIKGSQIHLNPLDLGISRVLARDGIRERESVEALYQYVQPDMTILDLGANIGFYVLLEAQIISKGSGKIIAIEPGLENYRLLNLNISENNLQDYVTAFHGAVSSASGYARLMLSKASNCHRLAEVSENNTNAQFTDVPTYSFSDFLKLARISIEHLDFLRMDIEGSEYLILPDIIEQISNKNKLLMFVEFHPDKNNIDSHIEILKRLESLGYRCLSVTKEYEGENSILRKHCPSATIRDLYTDVFFIQHGGCETFLMKG